MTEKNAASEIPGEVTCAICGTSGRKENMMQQGDDVYFCADCAQLAEEEQQGDDEKGCGCGCGK
ncbi:MAG TPA: hypothetical protein VM141_12725 [Planctomycetota bacterium]|nr:hypothetical protein [Planctomycetota bacterium]